MIRQALSKLTSSQALLGLLLLIGLLGMGLNGAAIYARLTYLAVLTLLLAWSWSRISLRGLSVQRKTRNVRASVGDVFEETIEIQNNSWLPRVWLQVMNNSSLPQAAGSRLVTWVGGRQSRSYLARTWLTRRGAFQLGPTTLRGGDPLGLFSQEHSFPAEQSLLVLPLVVPVRDFPSPPGLLPGGKAIRVKSHEITPHAGGVREYVHGDPLKRIHWGSTARRGRLMVKEFEQDPQSEAWILLDAEKRVQAEMPGEESAAWRDWMFSRRPELSLAPSTVEYGVAVAASLTNYFLARRQAVGLAMAGPQYTVLNSDNTDRQLGKVLELLAFVNGEGRLPLLSLVEAQAPLLPLGASVVLVTPAVHPEPMLVALDALARRNLRPVVILLDAASFGGPPGSTELAQLIQGNGVPVCRIARGDDLAAALSSVSQPNLMKESVSWQVPQTSSLLT